MEKWVLKNKKADFLQIVEEHKISEVLTRLLVNRDLIDKDEIDRFLNPRYENLHSPKDMKDILDASNLIIEKIKHQKRIRIVGDYDVDGVASTYILYTALKQCGAIVDYEIPDRIKDGYGININIIEQAYHEGIDTILTCDNGIAAIEQVERAKELGMTIVVTDHHDIPYTLIEDKKEYKVPMAHAVVNPKQEDCKYPFKGLCGAAVAFKLIHILYDYYGIGEKALNQLIEIVAIATICDVMDLVDENRIMVKKGLELLKNTGNLGLRALMELNNIVPSKLAVYHLGFIIGPCLNASGRLDTAKKGLSLLLSNTKEEADTLAKELKSLNDTRKEMTQKGFMQAVEMIENSDMKEDTVLVVYLEDCHESIAGIIAGRLKEKYYKPAIVLTKGEHGVKGSARSIEAYNIYEELNNYRDLMLKFGGHPMAAGLSLEYENVNILRKKLNDNSKLTKEDLMPKVVIDVVLPFGYLSEDLINEIERLEPFGKGNTKPLFAERNIKILKASLLGKDNNVLKLLVINEYDKIMDAIYFGDVEGLLAQIKDKYGQSEIDKLYQSRDNNVKLNITYYPSINEYNGRKTIQTVIQNYQVL